MEYILLGIDVLFKARLKYIRSPSSETTHVIFQSFISFKIKFLKNVINQPRHASCPKCAVLIQHWSSWLYISSFSWRLPGAPCNFLSSPCSQLQYPWFPYVLFSLALSLPSSFRRQLSSPLGSYGQCSKFLRYHNTCLWVPVLLIVLIQICRTSTRFPSSVGLLVLNFSFLVSLISSPSSASSQLQFHGSHISQLQFSLFSKLLISLLLL